MSIIRRHRCKQIKNDGEQCNMESLLDEDLCISHSKSDNSRMKRKKTGPLSMEKRIRLLEKQIHLVRKDKKKGETEKTKVMMTLLDKIDEYKSRMNTNGGGAIQDVPKRQGISDSLQDKINRTVKGA